MRRLSLILGVLALCTGAASAQTAQAPVSPPQALAGPAKSFDRVDLDSDAVRIRAAVRKAGAEDVKGKTADQLFADGMAARSDDPDTAAADFAASIAAGRDDAAVWLRLALAADAAQDTIKDNDDRKTALHDWAPAAAYLSYKRATSRRDEATALDALAALSAKAESWRQALDAYAASLRLVDDPATRKIYQAIREEHGFRITDYKIDSDSPSARVCFQFSESLAKGRMDFASYVAVGGMANAAVSADDQQLCVEGLTHGQRYAVTVRKGLPSAVGEDLLKSADYDIFVRDRSPQVHFVGKTYVLPRVGPEGIPVVSVNTSKVDVTILRIGDRNLAPTIRGDDFLNQLYGDRLDSIAESEGAKVWSGSLAVEQRLNEDVTTAFPVLEAVGRMEPGVYVMQARPHTDVDTGRDNGPRPTQWFVVSDLGLTALSGQGGVTAIVRSLGEAKPMPRVAVKLVAKNNEVLGTVPTDAEGIARFDPGLSRGTGGNQPALIAATTPAGDYNFLDLAQAPFDLTDRGVQGRPAPKGVDGFLYTERGVYRPGETVYITALVRDTAGGAAAGLPLTLVVTRPDGVEDKRVAIADAGLGGHALALPLLPSAATGTWRIAAYLDPKGEAIGEASFLVDDYLPERLAFDLNADQAMLAPGEAAKIATVTRFLYGAPGGGLEITGESVVEAAKTPAWPSLAGYETGLSDETVESVTTPLPDKVMTDAKGLATVGVPVPDVAATRPTEAKIVLRVGEPGGRAIERSVTLPIRPKTALIGVKKTFGALSAGSAASFDVVTVDPDGKRGARVGLHWSLYRLDNDYQWYMDGGHWAYERVKATRRIADGTLATAADAPAAISAPVGSGQHRLDISSGDPSLPPTSITFDVGWSAEASAPTPDLLDVTLDRKDYAPGDALHVAVHARFAGEATLAVANSRVRALKTVDLRAGDNTIDLPVGTDWGTGAYALVMAHRPLDAKAKRMPGRALGVAWFSIDAADRDLAVAIDVPEKTRPRAPLTIPIKLTGVEPGEEAEVTVSAVDVGILNLTRYETPKPGAFFFGQQALGTDIRDLYGFLIDGLGLNRGAIRSGGDSAGALSSEKPTQPPLARFSGIVKVGSDGTARVTFDIPAFNGTVRVSAVAWSRTRTGSASADVIVRDPIVVSGTFPRFLNLGDKARAHFELDNVEGAAGDYKLALDPAGPWFFPAGVLDQTVTLDATARKGLDVPLTAAGIGTASLGTALSGPDFNYTQSFALKIEPGSPAVYRRDIRRVDPGATLTLTPDLLAEFVPGSGTVSVSVSPLGGIDVPALLLALDRYPAGCSEQIVSRAMPLLYVNRLASAQELALDTDLPARINGAIALLLSRQNSTGSFGLWSVDSDGADVWLDSYVTDFLSRAKEAGYAIPPAAMMAALDRLTNFVANNGEAKDDDALSLAYAIYVLARNGRPVLGDLHYLAATRLDAFSTPIARAQIGAGLAMLGDRARAAEVFSAALKTFGPEKEDRGYRTDYGSRLRDAAAVLALAAEAGLTEDASRASGVLQDASHAPYPTTTQEQAWLVLAAQALESETKALSLTLDGQTHDGALYRTYAARRLADKAVVIGNPGSAPLRIAVTTSGQLPTQEPAASQGYEIERRYYGLDGKERDPSTVRQNDRLVVVLKVTEDEARRARVLLTDPLPAGFEIDNPDLVSSGSTAGLSFLPDDSDVKPIHTEFRDDRFTAAFDRTTDQSAFFSVAYMVRAVTPGRFVHPPATVEDMYRPERFGRTGNGMVEVKAAE
ncbi:MAG TPA: alpha-2-macroglobulin [Lichenihabitans sp.]|jgi:hypothetical protein|nr:alpha-2-macroglobulin [Lichenihabitans sp.]